MLTDGKPNESLLRSDDSSCNSELRLPVPLQAAEFPLPPAMPDAVLLLRLLVSAHFADLHAITEVIRNDVGLTVRALRLAALEHHGHIAAVANVPDIVVQVGLEKLKMLATDTTLIPLHRQNAIPQPHERFWMHARLTARISEELAGETSAANRETAYVAGLLRHLGALPSLLGWEMPAWMPSGLGEIGYRMAKAWQLPGVLAEVVRGDDRACTTQKAHSLLRLINMADEQAARWESSGCATASAWASS